MKLYAEVKSERACKGQGGNKFLDIKIKDSRKKILLSFTIVPPEKGEDPLPAIKLHRATYEVASQLADGARELCEKLLQAKGKQQKDEEIIRCGNCDRPASVFIGDMARCERCANL